MKRLFTFGCSFTNYHWPTWADILGLEYDHYENWGRGSSSNQFILYSLNEMLLRNTITPQDTIIIMWTASNRITKFNNNKWEHLVNYKLSPTDAVNSMVIDVNIMDAVIRILSKLKCEYHVLSMINYHDTNHTIYNDDVKKNPIIIELSKLYNDTITMSNRSIFDLVFNFNWWSRDDQKMVRTNIDPLLSVGKLQKSNKEYLISDYNNIKGPDWPDVNTVLLGKFQDIELSIKNEILYHFKDQLDIINQVTFKRDNHHPSVKEHFEYLIKLDLFNLTQLQLDQVETWDYKLLNGIINDTYTSHRTPFKRFAYN